MTIQEQVEVNVLESNLPPETTAYILTLLEKDKMQSPGTLKFALLNAAIKTREFGFNDLSQRLNSLYNEID